MILSFSAKLFFTKLGLGRASAHGPSGPSVPAPSVVVFKYHHTSASPRQLAEQVSGSPPPDILIQQVWGKSPRIFISSKFLGDPDADTTLLGETTAIIQLLYFIHEENKARDAD